MADIFSPAKRSEVMARIRAKDTKPEWAVRRAIHTMGFRFRLHDHRLPGRPDIVLPRRRLIVQVKGCFWHGHSCLKGRVPGTNRHYWLPKIERNRARDVRNDRKLRAMGWRVRTVWECRIRRWTPERLQIWLRRALANQDTPRPELGHPRAK
jgi:DNA mismatch endonuclease, patch repair protein